jgi:hypothetical protein
VKICLVASNRISTDPRALALAYQLSTAGHEVVAVAPDTSRSDLPFNVTWVQWQWPALPGWLGKLTRRLMPASLLVRYRHRALVVAARATASSLFYPTTADAVAMAVEAAAESGAVVRRPEFPAAGERDLLLLAPELPELASGKESAPKRHIPGYKPPPPPAGGRHAGRHIVLCYRKSERSPGRYLEAALKAAGVEVMLVTEVLDWETVPDHTAGVLFVESPLPMIETRGARKRIPVAFWVHHGELHLPTNLRLRRRYGADLVLLAHSWHLAHRFDVPVERFPFAVPRGLLRPDKAWEDRTHDVGFVGAVEGTYERRRLLLGLLESALGARIAIRTDVSPEEMADLYANSRIVINEGGSRHLPITMRVFEAVGSGALLLTDPVPGLDLILDSTDFVTIDNDVVGQIESLLEDPSTPNRAKTATERIHRRHTYDHRVDELFAALDGTQPRPSIDHHEDEEPTVIDIDVQRILVAGDTRPFGNLQDREVWNVEQHPDRPSPGNYEAVAVSALPKIGLDQILPAARRYIYAAPAVAGRVIDWALEMKPDAMTSTVNGVLRVDLNAPAYRISSSTDDVDG